MSSLWRMFADEIKSARGDAAVVVALVLLCLAPAVCAWVGIASNGNPVGNTGQLTIAVANGDQGYESNIMSVSANMGESVVSALREDDGYNWVFVDEEQAIDGVKSGLYYSAIVIPPEFSKTLMGTFTSSDKTAVVQYYANAKVNPISSMFASDDEPVLRSDISAAFSQHVTEAMTSLVSDVASASDEGEMKSVAEQLSSRLGIVADTLDSAGGQVDVFGGAMDAASSLTTVAGESLTNLASSDGQGSGTVGTAASALTQAVSGLRQAVAAAQQAGANAPNLATTELSTFLSDAESLASSTESLASSASGLSSSLASAANGLNGSTSSLSSQLVGAHDTLSDAAAKLYESAETVRQLRTEIVQALTEGNMFRLAELIGDNVSVTAQWLAAPVKIEQNDVFATKAYSSSIAPFYSVLALWAGACLLVVVLRPRTSRLRLGSPGDSAQGEQRVETGQGAPAVNWVPRVLVAVVQAIAVWLASVLFAGVQCDSPLLLLLTCVVCSLAFCALANALVVLFGRVGEALCFALLIAQVVAGSGYPGQMMGGLFWLGQLITPFSYAVNAMGECVVGMSGTNYAFALVAVCAFLVVSVVLMLVLRGPAARLRQRLSDRAAQTGLM